MCIVFWGRQSRVPQSGQLGMSTGKVAALAPEAVTEASRPLSWLVGGDLHVHMGFYLCACLQTSPLRKDTCHALSPDQVAFCGTGA